MAHPLAPDARPVNGRDLAWLVLSLVIVSAPHALRAPWWLTGLTLMLFAWRIVLSTTRSPLPSRWILFALAALAMFGIWAEYRILFGRSPGIILLMLFSGLKLLEVRTHRDATVVVFLCYFLVITNFLYSQSIPTGIAMGVALVVVTAALVSFNAPQRGARPDLRTASLLLAHAVPAALVLFVLFPRVQGPLWSLPQDAHSGVTGLSETMAPGNLAQLARSDAISFRAEFDGEAPPQPLRYWRGPVLWEFDGRTWRMGPTTRGALPEAAPSLPRYRYSVVIEPHDRNWLYGLETVVEPPPQARVTSDGRLLARDPVRRRLRYDLASVADLQVDSADGSDARALALPAGFNPRARALADTWKAAGPDDARLARAIAHLRDGNYAYTLEPPLLGRDSVDDFLFGTKAGFCEHFASAFVFLMRAADVPARVVTGYQGGELNPVDRIITVRQSDAHAWAEVFLQGRGWVRVDPTAAAIPGRIEAGLARALPSDAALPLLMRPQLEWLRGLRNNWEALTHQWNVWVLGYNPDRQRDLMAYIGMRDADWRKLTAILFTVLGGFTVVLVLWSLRLRVRPDPVQRAWLAFCRRLRNAGVDRAPHEGPRDFAQRAAQQLPHASASITDIAQRYLSLRYGKHAAPSEVDGFRRRVREIRLT
ncbi:MAG TPA: DUF3488 and transglutaminase-like domain-containing protein [Burkholderiales bacterium]